MQNLESTPCVGIGLRHQFLLLNFGHRNGQPTRLGEGTRPMTAGMAIANLTPTEGTIAPANLRNQYGLDRDNPNEPNGPFFTRQCRYLFRRPTNSRSAPSENFAAWCAGAAAVHQPNDFSSLAPEILPTRSAEVFVLAIDDQVIPTRCLDWSSFRTKCLAVFGFELFERRHSLDQRDGDAVRPEIRHQRGRWLEAEGLQQIRQGGCLKSCGAEQRAHECWQAR